MHNIYKWVYKILFLSEYSVTVFWNLVEILFQAKTFKNQFTTEKLHNGID